MGLRIKFSFRRFLFFTGTLEHDQEQWSNCRGRTMFSMQRLHEGGSYTIILQAQCLPRLWAVAMHVLLLLSTWYLKLLLQ